MSLKARIARAAAALLLAALAGCAAMSGGAETGVAGDGDGGGSRSELDVAADLLLKTDREFAARSLEVGAPEAFAQYFDDQGLQLSGNGEATGPESVRLAMAAGPPVILSWEPRYAEVFSSGFWGWTWGDWQAHEPGAGGRRIAQGRYVNIWKKQPDGRWKVRLDIGSPESAPLAPRP